MFRDGGAGALAWIYQPWLGKARDFGIYVDAPGGAAHDTRDVRRALAGLARRVAAAPATMQITPSDIVEFNSLMLAGQVMARASNARCGSLERTQAASAPPVGASANPNTAYQSWLTSVSFVGQPAGGFFLDVGSGQFELVPVPEPGMVMGIAAASLAGLGLLRRRLRRDAAAVAA